MILDAKGKPLATPCEVERALPSGPGGIRGVVTHVGRRVDVTWIAPGGPAPRTYATERVRLFSRKRRCPDLVRASSGGKSDG